MKRIKKLSFAPLVGLLVIILYIGFVIFGFVDVLIFGKTNSEDVFRDYFLICSIVLPFLLIIHYILIPNTKKKKFKQKYLLVKTNDYIFQLKNNENIDKLIKSLNVLEYIDLYFSKYNFFCNKIYMSYNYTDNQERYIRMLKNEICKIVFEHISESVKFYDENNTDTKIKDIYLEYFGDEEDDIQFNFRKNFFYNNVNCFISEIKTGEFLTLLSPQTEKYSPVFNGYFGYAILSNKIDCFLTICYKHKIIKLENSRVITTNDYFDNNHYVYSDNEILATKILSPSLLSLLEDIEKNINNITFEMTYKNNIIAFRFFAETFDFRTVRYKEMAVSIEKMEINIKNIISIMNKITDVINSKEVN